MAEELASVDRRQALGARLLRARLAAGKSPADSGALLGCSTNVIHSFESGRKSPTLPQAEALADLYGVPVGYFWQTEPSPDLTGLAQAPDVVKQRMLLRQKLIGVRLRQARQCAGKAIKEAAAALRVSGRRINQYECGEREISLADLEVLAELYGLALEEFMLCQEVKSPTPASAALAASPIPAPELPAACGPDLSHLDPELQAFVAKPINTLYLEAALKLSRLSVFDLRSLAESLLEITY